MTTSSCHRFGTLTLAVGLSCVSFGTGSIAARQPPGRHLVVISDLHFGVGKTGGAWHVMEDFRWAAEFTAFLDDVHRRANGAADLVIAGDAFELWQSLTSDCADPNPDRGCTEAEALSRLTHIVGQHGTELQALGAFARKGSNQVVFVPGNHDAALLFPRVAAAAVAATGDGTRVSVEGRGYWLSPDKRVLVEHGHQIGQEVNRFAAWPRPFVGSNPQHLQRPWGEQFVQSFYNQYEAKYPIIDNVSEESVGIRYAKEIEGWTGIIRGLDRFLYFYLAKLSLEQYVASLGEEGKAPAWDIDAIRKRGGQFLVDSLPSDDPMGRAARQPATQLPDSLAGIADAELVGICDARAQIAAYQKEHSQPATVTPCPVQDGTMGAIGQSILRSRETLFAAHLGERFNELEGSKQIVEPFKLFVYGHTHLTDDFSPLAKSHPDWDPRVLNTGAWQRTVTPAQLEALRCRTKAGQSLIELSPDELPACYNVVWVDPAPVGEDGKPWNRRTAKARYWTKGPAGTWSLEDTCRWVSPC